MANEQRKMGKLRAIFLPSDLDQALCAESERRKKSLSWVLREALIIYLIERGYKVSTCINPTTKGERTDLRSPFNKSDNEYLAMLLERMGEISRSQQARAGYVTRESIEDTLHRVKTHQDALDEKIKRAVSRQFSAFMEEMVKSRSERREENSRVKEPA